ncbi:MAG: RrF2 family transcriptional regulator [Candidatus Zixiibacteriota bacterium]
MFTLSKKTDYGLMAIEYLRAAGKERRVSAREISERYDIPAELLAKILQRLARHGMVEAVPGPSGGYHLAKDVREIRLTDVIGAVGDEVALISCLKHDHSACEQIGCCTVRSPLVRVQEKLLDYLGRITLEELYQTETVFPVGGLKV